MTPCGWGVNSGMVRLWVAGETDVWSPRYTRAISERFRDYKALCKFTSSTSTFKSVSYRPDIAVTLSRFLVPAWLAVLQRILLLCIWCFGYSRSEYVAYKMSADGSRPRQHQQSDRDGLCPQHLVRIALCSLKRASKAARTTAIKLK